MKNVFEKIVTQTGEYLKRYHLESLVLGLSGGLDSTVCAAVSYEVAKRYGIKVYLYINEPRFMPLSFFEKPQPPNIKLSASNTETFFKKVLFFIFSIPL